jgi:cation transporter-like permease
MNLIILLVVIGLIAWGVTLLPLPAPFPTIIHVILVIIAILAVLHALGVGVPSLRF